MRVRPAGPAQSSVFHNFARRGPTKEAHRQAIYRSDGLLHSVARQGHGLVRVTLPRGASDQRKRAEAGHHCPLPPEGPIEGGVEGPIKGGIKGPLGGPIRGGPRGP
jgi:hypothetical protein